jgi:hypothetical protein
LSIRLNSSFEDELAISKLERNVKAIEESVLPKKANSGGVHGLCEAYGKLILQHARDLDFKIEKIRELTSRTGPAE